MLQTTYDLTFSDLDERARQYNARGSVPDFDACVAEYARLAEHVRHTCPGVYDIQYGPSKGERLDIFPATRNHHLAPVFVFIHGGYWRSQTKEDASIMAEVFTEAGVAVVVLEYTLLPEATLPEVIRQVRNAIAWLYQHGKQYGIDPNQMFIGGSSAGGHLAAMAAAEGWTTNHGLPDDVVKGAACLSGLYDLAPLCDINVNEWLQMAPWQAPRVSPLNNLPRPELPMVLAVGGLETEGFKNQTLAYEAACRQQGLKVQNVAAPRNNHFDLLCEWSKAESPLTQTVLDLICKRR